MTSTPPDSIVDELHTHLERALQGQGRALVLRGAAGSGRSRLLRNPKLSMDLARHLVDTGTVRYENGHWTLPARVSSSDIPESADAPLRTRVLCLRALARRLLEAQALASHQRFTREDYTILAPQASAQDIDEAILELIAQGLVSVAGTRYELVHRNWVQLLTAHLTAEEQRERRAAIAQLYGDSLKSVFHRFAAKQEEQGLDTLLRELRTRGNDAGLFTDLAVSAWELGRLFECGLDTRAKLVGVACLTANDNHTAHAPRDAQLSSALALQLLLAGDLS